MLAFRHWRSGIYAARKWEVVDESFVNGYIGESDICLRCDLDNILLIGGEIRLTEFGANLYKLLIKECPEISFEYYHELGIKILRLEPDVPEDKIPGFISYTVNPDKPRVKCRTHKFLNKLGLSGYLKEYRLRSLADKVSNLMDPSIHIEILRGEDIITAYKNSVGSRSCMTGDNCQCVGLYRDNPDRIGLLVVRQRNDAARAVHWKLDDGSIYIDRIYASSNEIYEKLKEYVRGQGWSAYFLHPCSSELRVSGLEYTDGEVPYMDTFTHGTIRRGLLTVSADEGDFTLQNTEGYIEESRYECSCCGDMVHPDDVREHAGNYYCEYCWSDNFSFCEGCEEYYPNDDLTYIDGTGWYCDSCLSRLFTKCEGCGEYINNDDIHTCVGGKEICEECLENEGYQCCDICGEYDDDCSRIYETDECVCSECAEEFDKCEHCDNLLPKDRDLPYCCDCESEVLFSKED